MADVDAVTAVAPSAEAVVKINVKAPVNYCEVEGAPVEKKARLDVDVPGPFLPSLVLRTYARNSRPKTPSALAPLAAPLVPAPPAAPLVPAPPAPPSSLAPRNRPLSIDCATPSTSFAHVSYTFRTRFWQR